MTSASRLFVMSQILAIRGSSQRLLRIFIQFDILFFFSFLALPIPPKAPSAHAPGGKPPVARRRDFLALSHRDQAHPRIAAVQRLQREILESHRLVLVKIDAAHTVRILGAISTVRRTRWKHASVISASSSALCVLPERENPSAPAMWSRLSRGWPSLPTGSLSAPAS